MIPHRAIFSASSLLQVSGSPGLRADFEAPRPDSEAPGPDSEALGPDSEAPGPESKALG